MMKVGQIIEEKWEICEDCQGGGQGEVYKVKSIQCPEEKYALKCLKKQKDSERRKRMNTEVESILRLNNEHIPKILYSNVKEYENKQENLFYICDYIDGMTLETYVESNRVDFNMAIHFFVEMLNVLKYCHSKDVIHRDIKPDNIMIRNNDLMSFVLIDFGLSFNFDEYNNTITNQQLGNRFIILPELVSGTTEQKRLKQSDITQAAGVFLYILTGCIPHVLYDGEGKQPHQREGCKEKLEEMIKDRNKLLKINSIFDKCFQYKVIDRYYDESELLSDLRSLDVIRKNIFGGDEAKMNNEIIQSSNSGLRRVIYSELMNDLNPCLEMCNPAGLKLPSITEVEQLIPYGIALPEPVKEKSVKYYNEGDFATATEQIWPRAINTLRKRVLSLGVEFVADMVETSDLDYVRELPAYKVIELANELGFIDKAGKHQLLNANEYYNYYHSTETEEYEEMPQDEANIIIKNGIKYILYSNENSFGLQFNDFREKLKTGRMDEMFADDAMLQSCPYFYLKTTVRSLLNLFMKTEGIEFDNITINMNIFFPSAWKRLRFDEKKALADVYTICKGGGDTKRIRVLKAVMTQVQGFDYVNENERSHVYISVAKKLKDIHFGINNFYNEPGQIKLLEDLGTMIPPLALKDCVTAILYVKLGNQYGTSWDAEVIADRLLDRLTESEWKRYLEQYLKEEENLLDYINNCNKMRNIWKNIIEKYKLKELNITDVKAKRIITI